MKHTVCFAPSRSNTHPHSFRYASHLRRCISLPRACRYLSQSDYQYMWHATQMARNSNNRLCRAEQQFFSHHVPAFGIAAGDVTVRFENEKHCLFEAFLRLFDSALLHIGPRHLFHPANPPIAVMLKNCSEFIQSCPLTVSRPSLLYAMNHAYLEGGRKLRAAEPHTRASPLRRVRRRSLRDRFP